MKKNVLFLSVLCLSGINLPVSAQNPASGIEVKQTGVVTGSTNETDGNAIACIKIKRDRIAFAGNNKVLRVNPNAGVIDLNATDQTRDPGGIWTRISGTGGTVNFGAGTFDPMGASAVSVFRYFAVAQNGTMDIADVYIYVSPLYNKGLAASFIEISAPTKEQSLEMAKGLSSSTVDSAASAIACIKIKRDRIAFAGNNRILTVNPNAGVIDLNATDQTRDPGGIWTRISGTGGTANFGAGTFDPMGASAVSVFRYFAVAQNGTMDRADVYVYVSTAYRKGASSGSGTGLSSLAQSNVNELKVYPNPAVGRIMFRGISESNADIVIYGTDGRLAAAHQNLDLSQGLDVSHLPAGTYQLKATSGTQSYVSQFVVVH